MTCVAFSIKFAKTNQKFAENSEFCGKKFTIIVNYSLHSLGTSAVDLAAEAFKMYKSSPSHGEGDIPPKFRKAGAIFHHSYSRICGPKESWDTSNSGPSL